MRRAWDPTSANESSNRPEDTPGVTDIRYRVDVPPEDVSPREQRAPNTEPIAEPIYERDGIEIRAVRRIGLGRLVWIAKRQPWAGKHTVWGATATEDEIRTWLKVAQNPAAPPPFGRRCNAKSQAVRR